MEFQEHYETKVHKMLSPSTTRWLGLKCCIDRVLEQYTPLKEYFMLANVEDPTKTTASIVVQLNNEFTKAYL